MVRRLVAQSGLARSVSGIPGAHNQQPVARDQAEDEGWVSYDLPPLFFGGAAISIGTRRMSAELRG